MNPNGSVPNLGGPKVQESVGGLVPKEHARSSFEIEPIENYKGKSIEELEAILDAHNKHQAAKAAPKEEAPTEQIQPLNKEAIQQLDNENQ